MIATLAILRAWKDTSKKASVKRSVIMAGRSLKALMISLVKSAVKIVELVKEGLITASIVSLRVKLTLAI